MRIALIAGTAVLAVVLIFIIQNAHAVTINFLGAHLHLSLAVALLLAAIAGHPATADHAPRPAPARAGQAARITAASTIRASSPGTARQRRHAASPAGISHEKPATRTTRTSLT
jgi:hypothetical protein